MSYYSCRNEPTKPEEARKISIEVVDVSLKYVWMKVSVDSAFLGYQIRIYKDNEFNQGIDLNEMFKPDSVIRLFKKIDPSTSYIFHAAIVEGLGGPDLYLSNKVSTTTLDPGPLHVSWEIDTIGIWQTWLNAVWGSSPEDVYVGGYIVVPERTLPYTMMHWDGEKWSFMEYLESEPLAIFGFSSSDVWLVGGGGSFKARISHWNGSQWKNWKFDNYDALTGIWGSSPQDIYAVGLGGLILHYDGFKWTKMESGTTIPLRDVHGIGDKVFAVGGDFGYTEGILLELKNGQWETIYQDINRPDSHGGYGTTVWNVKNFFQYVYLDPLINTRIDNKFTYISGPDHSLINRIRGIGFNNIFIVGSQGYIEHFNGVTSERAPFYGDGVVLMNDVMVFENAVFVVAYSNGVGTIYRGTF